MLKKKFINIFKQRKRQPTGFTLIEVLTSTVIGGIIISALVYFMWQMLETNQEEFALAQTQVEMDEALSYIKNELEEAVYVYEGECLTGRGQAGDQNYCYGLTKWINFPTNVTPVLAFWKIDKLPYRENPTTAQNLPSPDDCNNNDDCLNTLLNRSSYTLVVYSLSTENPNNIWNKNLARITRYELRQFDPDDLARAVSSNPQRITQGWADPTTNGRSFASWPLASDGSVPSSRPQFRDVVLVDLVDSGSPPSPACPNGYSLTPPNALNFYFYACVEPYSLGNSQEVIVYLRGNAIERAGGQDIRNSPSYKPLVQTRVKTRAVFQRKPSSIK
ncbi:MAG: prepilin-type N-terminal cleavage/methylation domain-containing protein [Oscillatoriaceae bacterium SKW80]|nr:prepilin-type N-terminal cleavage/methylation domain-containing protein [Oscillatoriaceae bacterium SKYG93]MCX8121201.1 prepilin-type N-terminal cleavage/methylation domain-containing protein [Oscillatoriaceae bacterium SKW80]MDW8453469.1 prepilin-type N-terminal cleavage/methylation domain-containing protein [Oscillatoriaceae cyanobacterium SKYGB_i_bin93]